MVYGGKDQMTRKKSPKPRKRKLKERREHDPFSPENPFESDDDDCEEAIPCGGPDKEGLSN